MTQLGLERCKACGQPLSPRTTEQNSRMWAMLHDIETQVEWHGQHLTAEEWKAVFTAAIKKQKVVPGIDGGFVVLGTSTRRMTKRELTELMDFIEYFGVEHNVRFGGEQ
jgi:hypothetical protein